MTFPKRSYTPLKLLLTIILVGISWSTATAQTDQDKPYNRFQYHKYKWQVFHTVAFHIYFPRGYDSTCSFVARELSGSIEQVKRNMGATLQGIPNIIIYPSPAQLYGSNIGSNELQSFTLPTVVLKGSRLLLSYNGSYDDLKDQLKQALVRSVWEEQFRTGLDEQLKGIKAGEKIPFWFREGAIKFFANGWPVQAEDALKRSFEDNLFTGWHDVIAHQPRLAGQAFCYFLTDRYYPEAVKQLYTLLKRKGSLTRAVRLITKTTSDSLYLECFNFYKSRFSHITNTMTAPADSLIIPHAKGVVKEVLLSPDQTYIAYITSGFNQRTVWIYDYNTKKRSLITTYRLPPWIDDHSKDPYPVLSWQWDSRSISIAMPIKGKIRIIKYGLPGKKQEENTLFGVDGLSSLQSITAQDYLLAAYKKGQSDIVSYNNRKEKYTPYTSDVYDDDSPVLADNEMYFVSTRPQKRPGRLDKDSIYLAQGIYRLKDKTIIPYATDSIPYISWDKPTVLAHSGPLTTTTISGTERFGKWQLLAPYQLYQYIKEKNSLVFRHISRDSITLLRYDAAKWIEDNKAAPSDTSSPWLEDYRKNALARQKEDSILNAARNTEPSFLDKVLSPKDAKQRSQNARDSISRSLAYDPKKVSPYVLQLHSAYFTTKVNNDYFINRYQPYLNYQGQFKFPEVGGMAQGGFTDLFEDHHFGIAYRLPAGTEGSDFYVHYENTSKKTDWGLTWFRKVESLKPDPKRMWVDPGGNPYPNAANVKTNYYELTLHFPLSYYLGIDVSTAIRNDRTVFLATERYSLRFPDLESTWFISTIAASMNKLQPTLPFLHKGFKARLSLDLMKGFSQSKAGLYGTGLSFEYHQPIYKFITAVGKLQTGYSGGDQKLLYIFGGVDNNITPRVDTTVHFAQSAPYAFQTLITPLRGYLQNRLYGNQYALLNADIYFPIFQTLIPVETPLQSLNLLQLGIFTDLAHAKETWNAAADSEWLSSLGLSARTSLAGYPLRFDIAWPSSGGKPVWYLSLSLK